MEKIKPIKIKRGEVPDLGLITDLVAKYYEEEKEVDPNSIAPQKSFLAKAIEKKLKDDKRYFYFLFYLGEEVFGLTQSVVFSDGLAELILIYVLPEFRGQGLGKTILAATLEKLKTQGVKTIRTEIRNDNFVSHQLFSHFLLRPYSTTYTFEI